jgi:hypothetical protein
MWGIRMWDTLAASTRPFSEFHDQLLELQTAIDGLRNAYYALFVNLLAAAMPVILTVISWLTKMLNLLSMVIAALLGQKMVYQAITTAATQAGNAAKDALAGFDQLDILANNNNLLQFQQVPIDPGILKGVQDFKDKIAETWKWIKDEWNLLWSNPGVFFTQFWNLVVFIATVAWGFAVSKIISYWNNLSDPSKILIVILLSIAAAWALVTLFMNLGAIGMGIASAAMGAWNIIAGIGTGITTAFAAAMTAVDWPLLLLVVTLGLLIAGIVLLIMYWPQVTLVTKVALNQIANWAMIIFGTVISFINGILQAVINGINSVIATIDSIKFSMPSWMGGMSFGLNIQPVPMFQIGMPNIPHLAEGAVIPSNKPFMAMLGDQKSGTNIETPVDLLRSIMREEIGGIKADISISFNGSTAELVRLLKPHIDKENVRVGNSLVKNTGMVQL